MKKLIWILGLFTTSTMVFAYTGDYVWEEKFRKTTIEAGNGDAESQYDLGDMFERGRGTAKDHSRAFDWYLKAAKQGHKKASFRVGLAYLKGIGTKRDETKALKWLQSAASKAYERAQYYLAEMYETGTEVHKDLDEALKLYIQSRDGGYAPAIERVERVSKALDRASRVARARVPATHKVLLKKSQSTRDMLFEGGWKKRDHPSEFLPSNITKCKTTGPTIECSSNKQNRDIGSADITYTTKAVLYGIKESGEFKVSYRNNVTDIKVKNPDAKATVSLGWQDTEHVLECVVKSAKELNCTKNKVRKIRLTR